MYKRSRESNIKIAGGIRGRFVKIFHGEWRWKIMESLKYINVSLLPLVISSNPPKFEGSAAY